MGEMHSCAGENTSISREETHKTNAEMRKHDVITHAPTEGCQPKFPLLLLYVGFLPRLSLNSICHSDKESD